MDDKIQFQKNAGVLSAEGKHLGSLERVVVNPQTNVVTDIVVRTGGLLRNEEKVVSINLVNGTTVDYILLNEGADDLAEYPNLEEEQPVVEEGDEVDTSAISDRKPHAIPGNPFVSIPIMPVVNNEMTTQATLNIPKGTVALKEGAKVFTSDGGHVGNVERVLADPTKDTITHLVVSKGLFIRESKLVPIRWVSNLGEDTVQLRVNSDSVEELADLPLAG